MRNLKNKIVICQKYDPEIHGENKNLEGHFLCEYIYKCPFKYTEKYTKNIYYRTFVKNQKNAKNQIKPQIAEVIYLDTGECVCVLKTFWLRIFFRIMRSFMQVLKKKRNIHHLWLRSVGGKIH
jgi:hypothetical protein